jgi:hypothetical protein
MRTTDKLLVAGILVLFFGPGLVRIATGRV